jgi:signal transduction histidine kinase
MQDVVQTFRLAAEDRQVQLEVALPEDPPQVSADIGLMARVFNNLIENALRYTPAGGRVRLSLSTEKSAVAIRLSDTGCGIAPEDLPHVFERFYRARQDPSQHSHGGGLGLAIAQRILELHGSRIQVDSTLKLGTTFAFLLPLAA